MPLPAIPPFHPVLVHIPIVLIPLAALFGTLWMQWRKDWAKQAMTLILVLAAVGAIAAAISGTVLMNQQANEPDSSPSDHLGAHQKMGIGTAVGMLVLVGLWIWRPRVFQLGTAGWLWLGGLWLITLLVLVAAWYGGGMVWEDGP